MRQPSWRPERLIVIHLRSDSLTLPEARVRMRQPSWRPERLIVIT
jgi:hypothetical protein